MPNNAAAQEWLNLALHDLDAAKTLFEANHFNDTISFLLQQSIEKSLKSLLAFQNKKIRKTHDLVELYSIIDNELSLSEENIDILDIATTYYSNNRYPHSNYTLPKDEEIQKVIDSAGVIYGKVQEICSR